MCLWTTFSIFICITTSVLAQQDGGSLRCPLEWIKGEKVTLEFLIDESLFPSQCVGGSDNRPYFQRKPSASGLPVANCTAPDITASCSFVSGTLGCGCVAKNGSYIVQYNFNAHPDYNGWWSVDLACVDSFGSQQLTFSTASQCNNVDVKDGPCDSVSCLHGGTCRVDDNNQATCDCMGTNYNGDRCETNICADKGCNKGKCYVDGVTAKCDCTGTSGGDDCSDRIKEFYMSIVFGCTVLVAVVIIVFLVVVIFRLLWKRLFSCVICVIICVDNETKKKKLHTEKGKVANFVSEHFIMHCCCCCCCSWLGWCCLGRLMLRGKKGDVNDGRVEGGTVKRSKSMGCSMGCLWCLSSVQNVKVDVHDIEDNQVSVLITLTSPLSWYSEADDMPEKVKEYIRTKILKEPAKEQCHTSKPSTCFGFGCIAGSPDPSNEPPAREQSHTSKPSTCFGFGCIAGSPDPSNEPPAEELRHTSKPSMHLGVGCRAGSPDRRNEPPADYPAGPPQAKTEYTGNGNGSGR